MKSVAFELIEAKGVRPKVAVEEVAFEEPKDAVDTAFVDVDWEVSRFGRCLTPVLFVGWFACLLKMPRSSLKNFIELAVDSLIIARCF